MTFNEAFKIFIKKKLKELLPNNNVILSDDISYWYESAEEQFHDNDVIVIIHNGNASKTSAGQMDFFNGSIMIDFYVETKYKHELIGILSDLGSKLSAQGHVEEMYGYKASSNFNTPSSDSVRRTIQAYDVAFVSLIGTISWFDASYQVLSNFPIIKIDNTDVLNIFNYSSSSSVAEETIDGLGQRFLNRFFSTDMVTYTFSFIFDETNDLHKQIRRIANKYIDPETGIAVSSRHKIKIVEDLEETEEFEAFLNISMDYVIGNFMAINVTITR